MYKKSKSTLKFFIIMEALITAAMIALHNYYAVAGWGFLMLTNIGIFVEMIENEKKENGDSGKTV